MNYQYAITPEEERQCHAAFINSYAHQKYRLNMVKTGILCLAGWLVILYLLNILQHNYGQERWISTLPSGNIVICFLFFSALCIVSCIIQHKKFTYLKWSSQVQSERYQKVLSAHLDKIPGSDTIFTVNGKTLFSNNDKGVQNTCELPQGWEKTLIPVADGLYYITTLNQKKQLVIPVKLPQ